MHRSRICHIVIDCDDLDRATRFWEAAVGAVYEPFTSGFTDIYTRLRIPGTEIRLLLQDVPEPKTCKSRVHLDIETDDVEAECDRLEQLGAKRLRLVEENGFRFWVMLDPWGTELCILQPEFPDLLADGQVWST